MATLINRDIQSRVVSMVVDMNGTKELINHGVNLAEQAVRYCGGQPGVHLHQKPWLRDAVLNIRHLLSDDATSVEIKHNIDILRDVALEFKVGYFEVCPTGYIRKPLKMSDETLMGIPIGVVLLMICDVLEGYYEFKMLPEL